MTGTRIYSAQRILTMNPSMPEATHIAVRAGRVLGVGPLEALKQWGDYTLDDRFRGKIIMPGFVEGHSHALEGAMWNYLYLGYFDRHDPDGVLHPGAQSISAVQERLGEHLATRGDDGPVIAWGFDPVYFEGERLERRHLDQVTASTPVVVIHASLHCMTANSAMMRWTGLDRQPDIEGVMLGADGSPNGELQEMAVMHAVFDTVGVNLFETVGEAETLWRYARVARRTGVTTVTDLFNPLTDPIIDALREVTAQDDFCVRLVPAMSAMAWEPEEGIERVTRARAQGNERLHFGLVKMMTDGSIQGYTARLKWPYYVNGAPNGLWNAPPEMLKAMLHAYHQAGLHLHIHTNGDEAIELMLDAIEEAQSLWPRADHRHTLQHCQIIDHAQLRRAARLGVCLNMFANHLYYWGDVHREKTLGHERAQRLEPLATASRLGIPLAMHCDAPVTPMAPLFTAWCSVNRRTASGEQLGPEEALDVPRALHAITLGAAYTLRMDHLVGSLEVGKWADMAVLDEDPLRAGAEALKDIPVHATVLGGVVHQE